MKLSTPQVCKPGLEEVNAAGEQPGRSKLAQSRNNSLLYDEESVMILANEQGWHIGVPGPCMCG